MQIWSPPLTDGISAEKSYRFPHYPITDFPRKENLQKRAKNCVPPKTSQFHKKKSFGFGEYPAYPWQPASQPPTKSAKFFYPLFRRRPIQAHYTILKKTSFQISEEALGCASDEKAMQKFERWKNCWKREKRWKVKETFVKQIVLFGESGENAVCPMTFIYLPAYWNKTLPKEEIENRGK